MFGSFGLPELLILATIALLILGSVRGAGMLRPGSPSIPPQSPIEVSGTKRCPFCAEEIQAAAIVCKHCGRELNAAAARPTASSWNPGVAALLSLVLPGAGQMYKGQVANGIAWLIVVIIGYVAFIVPGLFLHFCCIVGAALGKRP